MRKGLSYLFLLLLLLVGYELLAQQLEVSFTKKEIQIQQGELISNVLKIYNPGNDSIVFTVNADFPFGWRQVSRIKEQYSVQAKDSLFLPFRYIPAGSLSGNNRFMIAVYLTGVNDQPLGNDLFWTFTQKRTSWSVSTDAGNKIYFKNGTNQVPFNISLLNTGTERQQIIVTMNNMTLNGEVKDSTTDRVVSDPINLNLNPYQDTSLEFVYQIKQGERNQSRIDIENYRPSNLNEERSFNLVVNTEEPNFGQPGAFQAGQRFQFKKLSDSKRADNNSFSNIPMVIDYNIANLFDEVTFATLTLRGLAQLSKDEQLTYNFQGSATNNNYTDFIRNNNYYIGYFWRTGGLQAGYINGGLLGIQGFGQGVKATYTPNNTHSISSYYVSREDRLGEEALRSYGVSYDLRYFKQNKIRFETGRSISPITGITTTAANTRASINFLRSQSISFSYSKTWNEIDNKTQGKLNNSGSMVMGNYIGNFFKSRFSWNHGGGYSDRLYANSNVERLFYNHRARWMFSDLLSMTLVNNYNVSTSYLGRITQIKTLTNQLAINRSFKTRAIQPLIFYNQVSQINLEFEMRGVGFNYNQFNPKTNVRFSTTVEGGVNVPKNIANATNTNYLQVTALAFFNTLTFNCRYIVGTYGYVPQTATSLNTSNQQLFSSSAQHQYLFANNKLMLQTGLNYSFNNIFAQHSINASPDFFYFTPNGWRFRLGFNYNIISGKAIQNAYGTQASAEEPERITTQNTFITAGIRKEIAIPIPFKKQKFFDVDFQAFFDVNGNGLKDKNEKVIDNVVVKLSDNEVITNENGEANIMNVAGKVHSFGAFPLQTIDGWFANIEDSALVMKNTTISIPFVKGVKIRGKIGIDLDAINANAGEPFDLGRIRVTANGKKVYNVLTDFNGNFEMYLPYGDYILTVDESILGSKFKLARNNYSIAVTKETDGLVISFLIVEKRRKVVRKVFSPQEPVVTPPANEPANPPVRTAPQRNPNGNTTPNRRTTPPRSR